MNNKKITMQDIADACGLSRNTVSKVFNGRGAVTPSIRDMVLEKARQMGYGSLPVMTETPVPAAAAPTPAKSIALLTGKMPADYHFATFLFTAFSDQISRTGYNLKMYEITPEEMMMTRLPAHFVPEETAGIIGIELFDANYLNMVCSLDLPTLFIDGPTFAAYKLMPCDFMTMENNAGVMAMVNEMIRNGATTLGFVGDIDHCGSFYERWQGFDMALREAGIPLNKDLCILAPDHSPYGDTEWLLEQLDRMPHIPSAFVCANDYLALHLMTALKKRGLRIPEDVMISGFDGIPQSAIVEPALTTVTIPGADIGRISADILLRRIANPDLPHTWTRIRTTPVIRRSTGSR